MGAQAQQQQQQQKQPSKQQLNIAFLHPDLGLGGAERLVVDAASQLAAAGHMVDVYTAYYDPHRCFDETRSGAFSMAVAGGWFPRAVAGRLIALCAVIRCCLVALHIAMQCWRRCAGPYDVVFVDQVAAVLPLLRLLLPHTRLLFYCHFPDMLLSQRASLVKRLYRAPLDWLEEVSTGMAHLLLVNSKFTRGVFDATFRRLHARGIEPGVLYPCVAIPSQQVLSEAAAAWKAELSADLVAFIKNGKTFLSINRFERKKGIGLAVTALSELVAQMPACDARLVVAGGYDARLSENVEHLDELKALVSELGINERVHFVPSFTDRQRTLLLAACQAVVYTPQHEHFGIVPLEAMAAGRPVIACNSGGPTESIVSGITGLLCEPTPAAFSAAFEQLLDGRSVESRSQAARQHVTRRFSNVAFGQQLNELVRTLVASKL